MRIVGGRHRGRRLEAPPGLDIRPTSDRAREGLFNMLEHGGFGPGGISILEDACVLDAFCGTGALGFEALSRGAAALTLMDVSAAALDGARATARTLGETERVVLVAKDATAPGRAPRPHDLVFLDPPYAADLAGAALAALAAGGWLAPGAIAVVETSAKSPPPLLPATFETMRERRYGAARLQIVTLTGAGSEGADT